MRRLAKSLFGWALMVGSRLLSVGYKFLRFHQLRSPLIAVFTASGVLLDSWGRVGSRKPGWSSEMRNDFHGNVPSVPKFPSSGIALQRARLWHGRLPATREPEKLAEASRLGPRYAETLCREISVQLRDI